MFGHAEELPIRWLIRWRPPQALRIKDPARPASTLFEGSALAVEAEVAMVHGQPVTSALEYTFAGANPSRFAVKENRERSFS